MCGLVGMISRNTTGFFQRDVNIFKSMLVMDGWWRGMDSTGVFQVLNNRQVGIIKQASHPFDLFNSSSWEPMERRMVASGRVQIGHNRKATQGAVNSHNAHPFVEGSIILVHNGTLWGHKELADTEVDSQAIARTIDKEGAEAALKKLRGAFALIWYDLQKEKLFAVRNKERPLFLTVTERVLFLNSEPWMARAAVGRDDSLKPEDIKEVIDIAPGMLYEFKLDGTYTTSQVELAPQVTYTAYEAEEFYCGYATNYGSSRRSHTSSTGRYNTTKEMSCALTQVDTKKNVSDDYVKMFPQAAENFSVNSEVLIKIQSIKMNESNNKRLFTFTGQTMSPGKPAIDVKGSLPVNMDESEVNEWYKYWAIATVASISYTNCGAYLNLSSVKRDTIIETHNSHIGEKELNFVVDNCLCNTCTAAIFPSDAEFTSIKRVGTNTQADYRVVCADCIEKAIPEGKVRDEFIQRRYSSLQDGEQLSEESVEGTQQQSEEKSTPTLH